jgi:hypothetical protein
VLGYSQNDQRGLGYLQLFRDGKIEGVETRMFRTNEHQQTIVSGLAIAGACIGCARRVFELFKLLGVEPPCAVMLTLTGVKDHVLVVDEMGFSNDAIDRDTLIIPPEVAEERGCRDTAPYGGGTSRLATQHFRLQSIPQHVVFSVV